jgi:DNA processing protein
LRGYPIGIVSGLALGIDALAHEAALKNNLYTVAVPGSGLDDGVIYPRSNRSLATRILEHGGGLVSEFPPDTPAAPWTFPQRNRIMAGIAPATLMIEANEKSGTLITARMCVDYNRELLVVPGSIFSRSSAGPHQFLKLGATPITCAADILDILQITPRTTDMDPHTLPIDDLSPEERAILAILIEPSSSDHIMRETGLTAEVVQSTLMLLELKGYIVNSFGTYRVVV